MVQSSVTATLDTDPPRPAFDALVEYDGKQLATEVVGLRLAGLDPDWEQLRARMGSVLRIAGGRDARREVLQAARRELHELTPQRELAKALALLQWVSDQAYGTTTKRCNPCAIQ